MRVPLCAVASRTHDCKRDTTDFRAMILSRPIRLKGVFSEGGDVIKLHIEGSLTTPTTVIKGIVIIIIIGMPMRMLKMAQALGSDLAQLTNSYGIAW